MENKMKSNKQLKSVLCAIPKCQNLVEGNQEKYCSKKCLIKSNINRAKKVHKSVYKNLGNGPRNMISASSIKHSETLVSVNNYAVDDYHVDPDIFAIAEANHEKYVLERNEYEAAVVIDGLQIFKEEHDKNHKISYSLQLARKRQKNLNEDMKVHQRNVNAEWQRNNREKVNAAQRARYMANPEKYRNRSKKYYNYRKQPDLYKFEKWLKKKTLKQGD